MSLAIAKIHAPPRPPSLLLRPRLSAQLSAQLNRQLLVVAAPAGFGKTSLLLDLLPDPQTCIAWYALDEFDNTPHVFMRYLIESVRVHDPAFGVAALRALETADDTLDGLRPVIAALASELFQLPTSVVFVLDDYHVIQSALIDQCIGLLIQYAREHAHILLSSRSIPFIPDQVQLLARGQFAGLGTQDLRFNTQEIQALLQQNYGLVVPEARAGELAAYSDGWITALVLLGHQLGWAQLVSGALQTPQATEQVYQYLVEQVFAKQPPDFQHFMLGSAVLERMTPAVLDRLPDLSQAAWYLGKLLELQLFLTRLGGDDASYRYHPLFRQFLLQRLRAEHPAWYAQLGVAAAQYYQQSEQWEHAIEAFLALGRTGEAIRVLEQAEQSLRALPQVMALKPWLDQVPASAQLLPHVVSMQGKIHMARGELEQALEQFERSASLFLAGGDAVAAADKMIWKSDNLRGLGRYQESVQASFAIAELLLAQPDTSGLRATNLLNRGSAQYELGDLRAAQASFCAARELLSESEDLVRRAQAAQYLGAVERALGSIQDALACYREALALWERAQRPLDAANTLNSLGNIHQVRGDYDEAETVLRDALGRARATKALRTQAIILCTLGDVFKDERDYMRALDAYADGLRLALEAHYAFAESYCQLGTGDVYRLLRDFVSARDWLQRAATGIQAGGSRTDYARLQLMRSKLARDQGRLDEALPRIAEAASLYRQAGDKHHQALAEFLWAQALEASGKPDEATAHLTQTASLVTALNYDQFLVVEGEESEAVLQYASTLEAVGPLYQRVLARVQPGAPHSTIVGTPGGSTSALTVFTLGQERFLRGDTLIGPLRPQVRDIFLFLLMRHPKGARPDELWEMAWPELPEARADSILHMTISRIRKTLCAVELVNGWYFLNPRRLWYDAREFERGVAVALRAQAPRTRLMRLAQALELYGGDYLQRLDGDWVLTERERLRHTWLSTELALAEAYAAQAEYEDALRHFQHLNSVEPFLEEAWQGAVQTLARMGNRAASLAYYDRYALVLREEIGLEPSTQAQALRQRILDMDG